MQGRKYINLVEIGSVVLEIQKVEFGSAFEYNGIPNSSTLYSCEGELAM